MTSDGAPPAADHDRSARRHALVTAGLAAASVLLAAVGALAWGPWVVRLRPSLTLPERPEPEPDTLVENTSTVPDQPTGGSDWLLWVLGVLALLLALLVVVGVSRAVRSWLVRRSRPLPDPPSTVPAATGTVVASTEAVVDAVLEALARLDGIAAAGDAVVAAWLVLEEAVAREGVVRAPSQTQAELTRDVLEATAAPPDATTALLRTYEAVRFGTRAAEGSDVAAARAALGEILDALRAGDRA